MLLSLLVFFSLSLAKEPATKVDSDVEETFTSKDQVQLEPSCAGTMSKDEVHARNGFTKHCYLGADRNLDVIFVVELEKEATPYAWKETEKLNDIYDGSYVEWSKYRKFKRVGGGFANGKPKGSWTVKGYGTKDNYVLKYNDKNILSELIIAKGESPPTQIKVQSHASKKSLYRKNVGFFLPTKVDPSISIENVDDKISLDHVLFYSSVDKKSIVGVAITNYRFLPNSVCDSDRCDQFNGDGSHIWSVIEKQGDMCMTSMPAKNLSDKVSAADSSSYDFWFDCKDGFVDLFEYYQSKNLHISSYATLYKNAGGEVTKVKGVKDLFREPDFVVKLVNKKMVDNELWVEIELKTNDSDGNGKIREQKDLGTFWIPFFGENYPVLKISEGC